MNRFFSIVLLAIMFMPIISSSQSTWTDEELLNIANRLRELEHSDSLKTEKIDILESLLLTYEEQTKLDSLYISYQRQETELLRQQIELLEKQLKIVEPNWYESKWVYFTAGAGLILVSSWVVGNVAQ